MVAQHVSSLTVPVPTDIDFTLWIRQVIKGLTRYQLSNFSRLEPHYKVLTSFGNTRLLLHPHTAAQHNSKATVLIVPSLINRYEIADLLPDMSLFNALQQQGFRPILIDWGVSYRERQRSDLAFYTRRLEKICRFVTKHFSSPLVVSHCLGGLLSLGAGLMETSPIRGMVFVALPWDFSETHDEWGFVPSNAYLRHDMIRDHFLWQNAVLSVERFRGFGIAGKETKQEYNLTLSDRSFIAIEDWLSLGDDMSLGLSEDLRKLCGKKLTRQFMWWLDGISTASKVEKIGCPSTVFLPLQDKIVPPHRTVDAITCMGDVRTIPVKTGHLGLIAGRHIPKVIAAVEDTFERCV